MLFYVPVAGSVHDDLWYTGTLHSPDTELDSVTRFLDVVEGNRRIDGAVVVGPHRTGLDPVGDIAGSFRLDVGDDRGGVGVAGLFRFGVPLNTIRAPLSQADSSSPAPIGICRATHCVVDVLVDVEPL